MIQIFKIGDIVGLNDSFKQYKVLKYVWFDNQRILKLQLIGSDKQIYCQENSLYLIEKHETYIMLDNIKRMEEGSEIDLNVIVYCNDGRRLNQIVQLYLNNYDFMLSGKDYLKEKSIYKEGGRFYHKIHFIGPSYTFPDDIKFPENTILLFDPIALEQYPGRCDSLYFYIEDNKESEFDEFHYHEVIDRCHVINSMIDDHLLSHPVIDEDVRLREKIEKAQRLISEVYQEVGGKY